MSEAEHIQAVAHSLRIAIEAMQDERLRLLPLASAYYRYGNVPGFPLAEARDAAQRCAALSTAINDLRALLELRV